MTDKDVLLRVSHLSKYFEVGGEKHRAVDDVSFDIKKGEIFGLVGESGCGKTTLGRTVIGLYPPTLGEIYFNGNLIASPKGGHKGELREARKNYRNGLAVAKNDAERHRLREQFEKSIAISREKARMSRKNSRSGGKTVEKIQMIFQDPSESLDPRMTVREIIAEGLIIQGKKGSASIDRRVSEMLTLVGLRPEHGGRYPHEFSGGQRQRIGIARAVIMNPELMIADEPVSALDVSVQAQIINLLGGLRDKLGMAILFVAHDLSVVKYFCDRVGVMYYGRIVELAPSNELFCHPIHPYTKALLSAIPHPDPIYERSRRRIEYDPSSSIYTPNDTPRLREVVDGHFVMCNSSELEEYQKEYKV